jgi:hypothetical protein
MQSVPFDWLAFAGTCCLGIVMMWLVRLFAVKIEKPTISWLGALASALLGGVTLKYFNNFSVAHVWPREFWGYTIGLVVGLFVFSNAVRKEMDRKDRP